jgi:hypothetical protein
MDPGSCRIHLEQVLGSKCWPLVVEENGQIKGEMEVVVGPDPVWGMVAHIDVLQVHREFQRKGMGKALVMDGLARAIQSGCDMYTTCPADSAVGFYAKCGLTNVIAGERELTLPVDLVSSKGASDVERCTLSTFDPLLSKRLLLGRYQTSFSEWLKGKWAVERDTGYLVPVEEGFVASLGAYYRLSHWPPGPRSLGLKGWVSDSAKLPELIATVAQRVRELGSDTIITSVDVKELSKLENIGGTYGKESMLLGRVLTSA